MWVETYPLSKKVRERLNLPVIVTNSYPKCTKTYYSRNYSNAIIESDSFISVQAFNEHSIPPRQIWNLIEDINMLVKDTKNVKFAYNRRSASVLTDSIANEIIRSCIRNVVNNV